MNATQADPALRHRIRTTVADRLVIPRRRPSTTRRIRVAHVLYRWSRSGMELQLAGQLSRSDPRRIAAWIASNQPAESMTPELPVHVVVRVLRGAPRSFASWLADRLRATATDVVHARGLWMLPAALRAARRAGGLPVVFSFHGFDDATRRISWLQRQRWRDALHRCAAIVSVCEASRAEFARGFQIPAARIEVIPNGVDAAFFRPASDRREARRALGLPVDRPTLLCVGSLLAVKGGDVLIDALATMQSADRPAAMCFVGVDHLHGALHRRAAERLPELDVRFVGNVADVRPYYAAADALVVPSRSEGCSNAIIEAMACGLPVIATRVGGNPELVVPEETGWLVPRGDPAALAQAVGELLAQPDDARRRGLRGRQRVMRQFTLERAAERYAALYERASSSRPNQALRTAISPRRAERESAASTWPLSDPHLRWYSYGRAAWWHLLAALDAGPGDNVLLPDLICDVMVEPLAWLGVEPRFYRCDPLQPVAQLEPEQHADKHTRALLAVHYFGLAQPTSETATWCRQRGIAFVADAAHGCLTTHEGRPLGADADALLLSFRKLLPLPNGAGLIAHSAWLRERLDQRPTHWPPARRDALRFWAKRIDRRLFGGMAERCFDRVRASRPSSPRETPGDDEAFFRCLMQPCGAAPAIVGGVDLAAAAAQRREAFARLAARWRSEPMPGEPLITRLEPGWVPYAFAVRPVGQTAESLREDLARRSLPAEVWPRLPAEASADVRARRWVLVSL